MARSDSNAILKKARGAIGKQIVIKQYGKKTVITAYPDMSHVKPSQSQQMRRNIFKEAVTYAQGIIRDKKKKAAYAARLKKDTPVYHAAIKEYMKKNK
jgi:cation transport regulator ChaB